MAKGRYVDAKKRLRALVDELTRELARVNVERDAAVRELMKLRAQMPCPTCKAFHGPANTAECKSLREDG